MTYGENLDGRVRGRQEEETLSEDLRDKNGCKKPWKSKCKESEVGKAWCVRGMEGTFYPSVEIKGEIVLKCHHPTVSYANGRDILEIYFTFFKILGNF